MANDIVGSLQGGSINNISYDVASDANVTVKGSRYENSGVPSSSRTMRKKVKRAQVAEGLVFLVNTAEFEILQGVTEGNGNIPLSFTLASGDTYNTEGWIEIESYESEEGRLAVTMFPAKGTGWDRSIA